MTSTTASGSGLLQCRARLGASKPKAGEIASLTGLRGITACFVMFFHLSHGQIVNPLAYRFIAHGYLAVDLFLVLSGFVLALTYCDRMRSGRITFPDFLVHRLIRIWPVYALLTMIYACLTVARGEQSGGWLAWMLTTNLTMTDAWALSPPIIGPGWSISAEWAACLLFPALVAAAITRSWASTILSALAAGAVLITISLLPWRLVATGPKIDLLDIHDWRTVAPVIRCLADFTFGLVLYRLVGQARSFTELVQRPAVGLAVAVTILAALFVPHSDLIVVMLFLPFILHLTADRGPVAAFLKWRPVYLLGLWSYAIYLVHYRTTSIWFALSSRLAVHLGGYAWLSATLLLCIASIGIAAPLHLLFEKPVQRYLRRRYDEGRSRQLSGIGAPADSAGA